MIEHAARAVYIDCRHFVYAAQEQENKALLAALETWFSAM